MYRFSAHSLTLASAKYVECATLATWASDVSSVPDKLVRSTAHARNHYMPSQAHGNVIEGIQAAGSANTKHSSRWSVFGAQELTTHASGVATLLALVAATACCTLDSACDSVCPLSRASSCHSLPVAKLRCRNDPFRFATSPLAKTALCMRVRSSYTSK
jgi:hypothetical protein